MSNRMLDTHISLAHGNGGRFMRDPNRGVLATESHELQLYLIHISVPKRQLASSRMESSA